MMDQWITTAFKEIDAKDIASKADKYSKICTRIEKALEPNPIQVLLKERVSKFKDAMPIVTAFRNERLQETHWQQIKDLVQKDFDIEGEDFTLNSLLELDVNEFKDDITAISLQATKEWDLNLEIEELDEMWKKVNFNYKDDEKTNCLILADMDDIFTALDEGLAKINTILASRYVKPLRERAEKMLREMNYVSDMIDEWIKC